MYRLLLKPLALQTAQYSYDWYEERQPGLGELFLNDLDISFDKVELNPNNYSKIYNEFRQAVLKTFPYAIIFEIIGDEIIIYQIFHTKQNPIKKFRKK